MPRPAGWTQPYFGVQHLRDCPAGFQITLEDRGEGADVSVLSLRSAHPFTPIAEAYLPLSDARAWGEARALALTPSG